MTVRRVLLAVLLSLLVSDGAFAFLSPLLSNNEASSRACFRGRARSTLVWQSSSQPVLKVQGTEKEVVSEEQEFPDKKIGTIVFLVPEDADQIQSRFGSSSPVGNATLLAAVEQLSRKSSYFSDGSVDAEVILLDESVYCDIERLQELCKAEVVLAMGLRTDEQMEYARLLFAARRGQKPANRRRLCHFALECSDNIPAVLGPYDESSPSLSSWLLPWTKDATGRRLHEQMSGLFSRWTSDDFCCAVMLFLNQFSGSEIDWVKHSIDATWEKGPARNAKELYQMVDKCGDCIGRCLRDDNCRECIGKLTELDSRDQVASYRTIVSYESKLLTDFSLCILTKHNIFECDAEIPKIPKVKPLSEWRGRELSEEDGRALLVGHLDDAAAPDGGLKTDISWKVACGANVAYDQFPSQNQLFYPAAKGRDMWYDPVFRVETLDGRSVWCKRHYKVRPQSIPGTFRFSFLDNGVTSNEFWTIVGAADELSWIVFHYAGAASSVGQRYLGGLLCTPDGSLPDESQLPQIWELFQSAGIQPWELYKCDNRQDTPSYIEAGPPPLDFYRKDLLAKREAN